MTLLELLHLVKKKWYLVVLFPILFALVTSIFCWGFMTNDFTSSVSLYVLSKSDSTTTNTANITNSDTAASQQLANDIAVMVKTNRVSDATAKALGLANLNDFTVKVDSATTNRVITLKVTGKRPDTVAVVANELAKQTSDIAVEVMDLKAVNVVDKATTPTEPSGPNRMLYTAVAFLAGLFVAIALIVLMDMMNTTIKSADEAEEVLGLPVLGRMPMVKGKDR